MSARKPFDKKLYEKYDKLARIATKAHLKKKGFTAVDHHDKYAQDLIASKTDEWGVNYSDPFCVECEVKIVWSGPNFPYDTVQLPQRKKKFFKELTLFYIWNKELTHAVMFWSQKVKHLKPVEVKNKYVGRGEYFYQIPLDLTTIIKR